jgi:hypothetical protein
MIPQTYRDNFSTLQRAFDAGDACLLECRERATGQLAFVICVVNSRGTDFELVPFGRLFDENPYDLLAPPGELQDRQ